MAHFAAQPSDGTAVLQLEVLVRTAIFKPANELVGLLLQQAADRADAAYQAKSGERLKGRESIKVQGIFGSFELLRDYYHHAGKHTGHCPADAALGLAAGYTPALSRLICLEGADEASYEKASTHLQETGGIPVSGRQVQRVVQRVGVAAVAWQKRESPPAACDAPVMYVSADGTGVPMRRSELAGRAGKQPDGSAKTRQVYLGCVFTQHKMDEQGHPMRDFASTSYVSSLDGVEDFGLWLRREALRRGMGGAKKLVLLIDGASGLEKLGKDYFPGELQIVDFYHGLEHLEEVLKLLWEKSDPQFKKQRQRWIQSLLKDGVERIIAQARRLAAARPSAQEMEKALGYFERNKERMRYGSFRRHGYFIGSGVIEAGCKTVVGSRCKQSGMFWSTPGAEHVLAFRCIHHSHRTNAFWKDRLNDLAARNDALPLAA
jgi:Uncharacterised protein family (UPF0236)